MHSITPGSSPRPLTSQLQPTATPQAAEAGKEQHASIGSATLSAQLQDSRTNTFTKILLILGPDLPASEDLVAQCRKVASEGGLELEVVGDGRRDIASDELRGLQGKIPPCTPAIVSMHGTWSKKRERHELLSGEKNNPSTVEMAHRLSKLGIDAVTFYACQSGRAADALAADAELMSDPNARYVLAGGKKNALISVGDSEILDLVGYYAQCKRDDTIPSDIQFFMHQRAHSAQCLRLVESNPNPALPGTVTHRPGPKALNDGSETGGAERPNHAVSQLSESEKLRLSQNILFQRAHRNDAKAVGKLLAEPDPTPDINARTTTGATALHLAAMNGCSDVIATLIRSGACLDLTDSEENTALDLALENEHIEAASLLVEAPGIDINRLSPKGFAPLHIASRNGWTDLVKGLLGVKDIEVNASTLRERMTALHAASRKGHADVIRELLGVPGIDVNQYDVNGTTPLLAAARKGHIEAIELLLSAEGIDVNDRNNAGESALQAAAEGGHVEAVRLLLQAKELQINDTGGTFAFAALHAASRKGRSEVVEALLEHPKIDVNLRDDDGRTPLILAAERGRVAVVEALLAVKGLDVGARDSMGLSALDIARASQRAGVVAVLEKHLAI